MSKEGSKPAGQIALPLVGLRPETAGRIVVGDANAAVVAALGAAADWPFRTAILVGPPRSGKSLLARWFVEQGAKGQSGEAVDDADRMDETELFHRWNRAQEQQTPLLLTASLHEGGWQIALPDLRSRLAAALWLEIGVPDDAMMEELITAHCEARGLAIGVDGARYLASRAERSHLGAERLVAVIDRISLERKTAPGQAIWREALEELNGPVEPRLF